jgi:hypothetical protein
MIWNPKKRQAGSPAASPADDTAPEQLSVTVAARRNLVALLAETAGGTSHSLRARQNGIMCAIGSTDGVEAEARFDHYGLVRELAVAKPGVSLFKMPFSGNALVHAQSYIAQPSVQRAFHLQHATLVPEAPVEFDFGTRVAFKQHIEVATTEGIKRLPVIGGQFNVFFDSDWRMTQVGSTVRHGEKPRRLGKLIAEETAISVARAATGIADGKVLSSSLQASAFEGKFDPVYVISFTNVALIGDQEVSVVVDTTPVEPRFVEVLVHAKSGAVLHLAEKLRHSQVHRKQKDLSNPLARVLLRIPNYKVDILKQIFQVRLDEMPDPTVLKEAVFKMFTLEKSRWQLVKPDANGGYEFDVGTNSFAATVAYHALSQMRRRFEKLGFRVVRTPIPVKVNDPQTPDNAFMVPEIESPEMHIGVGTGVANGGLTEWIALCIDVEWHELFHWLIAIQTPGNDLPGEEGADMHEGLADTGAWLFGWLFLIANADVLGVKVTRQDIANDVRKIGEYCMPPNGIRQQKNTKTMKDKTHEPHDDGEIIGGAVTDFFADFIAGSSGELVDAIEACVKMLAQMLALMPAKRPLFTDALRGLISADLSLNKGANRAMIEKSFKAHLITLSAGNPPAKKRRRNKKRKAA